ncbi:valine--tRNA ligase [Parvularcula marina]|uniref:Valine--tRNA ligase n=1 Tax=Parvularcula marina TaxID=2292771 RepID=A0A371RKQ8_9PROT|nr:valine--tRNA ligase [Parvularcula marina]RFB05966.1 valine--tRNA ligase [Parvularcula marina]
MTDENDTLPKQFDHQEAEARLYAAWEDAGCFKPSGTGEPYCVVIPPPNVTGSLHMGHALNNTLQDILIRFNRMRGKNVLWQVGTDHAGIATQMVVERQMMERQEPHRREIGREKFVERVWEWKAESAGAIQNQLRRLGASCDWSRERFTMDEGLSAAVRKVFVQLYNEGLIYRDKRLVNWDPKLLTAISDLEVETREVKGHMWHFAYPLTDGSGEIVVATTRPETMLGDTGVAVHPDDERYKHLIGKTVTLPIVGREIPIVADEHADPEQGTGAVKITPAHDFNDFEVGKRAGLEQIIILDFEGRIVTDREDIPEDLRGLDRFKARERVVELMEAGGHLKGIEDKVIQQPFGDRSNVVIEPMLTDQWYVDAETMAEPALKAVQEGKTKFIPENWTKTYYQWLENIQPWCISRQLWWGHQIPVWYGLHLQPIPDTNGNLIEHHPRLHSEIPFCALTVEEIVREAEEYYGRNVVIIEDYSEFQNACERFVLNYNADPGPAPLYQDPDVLDTWFSSALWPFSTLGWPDETPELEKFYPTATLSTAFDIIFFWVARMMMMGMHFMKEVPFKDVYIHAIVRDEHGQKMSKSKGNVIDPLIKMDEYGTDSLRFTLAAMAAPGRDVKLADQRIEGYRNFRTKLWNAARFAEMNECAVAEGFDPAKVQTPLAQWILHEASAAEAAITTALDNYRFDDAANAVYQFTWNIYCDWFLEFAKPVFHGEDEAAKAEIRSVGAYVLDRILVLLHPFMPFVTEELWAQTGKRDGFVMLADWQGPGIENPQAAADLNAVIELISEIRSLKAEMNIPPSVKMPLTALSADDVTKARLTGFTDLIERLARIEGISFAEEPPKGAAQLVVGGVSYALAIADFIDLDAEKARLTKEIGKTEGEIKKIDGKLSNENFVSRAPKEVVEEQHARREAFTADLEKLKAALSRLEAL